MRIVSRLSTATVLLASLTLAADVKLPTVFGDGMVLQRNAALPVWGTADPGEEVTVSFNGQTVKATAGDDGKWQLALAPMPEGGPFDMTVKGKNELKRSNVLIGDVWLCGGQSNMEWMLRNAQNGARFVAQSTNPNIRIFGQVPHRWADTPQQDVKAAWQEASPESVANFSAVGFLFGQELNKELNVPIGLIGSYWGGSRIEPWISPCGFAGDKALKNIDRRVRANTPGTPEYAATIRAMVAANTNWNAAAEKALAARTAAPLPPARPADYRPIRGWGDPTAIYNGMIAPLAPYALRGVIWYQGCSNVRDKEMDYKNKLHALARSWRHEFKNPELPIYVVQLAPCTYKTDPTRLPLLQFAQQQFSDEDPHSGLAVINDIGHLRDIHPRNKHDVAHRLALQALKKTYGRDIKADSPFYASHRADGGKMIVTFRNAESLRTRDGKAPDCFEIAGLDGVFHPAAAAIDGKQVVLTSDKVAEPLLVRFAWNQTCQPNLRNEADLQAGPFTAGKLPERAALDSLVLEAKDYQLVFSWNPSVGGSRISYLSDHSKELTGSIKRIAYFVQLTDKQGGMKYVFVSMDAFTDDLSRVGVPVAAMRTLFQTRVKNLHVASNAPGVKTGDFAEGNIEFWSNNYAQQNAAAVPGANNQTYDFGDRCGEVVAGHGSMQVHNFLEKQTVFAYNNWKAGSAADLGIGNSTRGNPDWTFAKNAGSYSSALMMALVQFE